MRPVSLTIEGLTAFRQPQTIDLANLDLFVITGATGAGKTSILDAVTFALYGNVCRVKKDELRDLITHNAPAVKVELDFEIRGESYRIIRRMKRKGQPEALLEKKERDEYVAMIETSGVKAVNARIESLLGLDFDAFTKAVLLPQGRFHEFLNGEAGARRDILSRLLELDRYIEMGTLARQKAREISISLDQLRRRLEEDYADATPGLLSDLNVRTKTAGARLKSLAEASARANEVAADAGRHAELIGVIEKDLEPLRELRRKVASLLAASQDVSSREETTGKLFSKAQEAMKLADADIAQTTSALAETLSHAGGDEVFLNGLLEACKVFRGEAGLFETAERDALDAKSKRDECSARVEGAGKAADEAAEAVETAIAEGERLKSEFDRAELLVKLAAAMIRVDHAHEKVGAANLNLAEAEAERGKNVAALVHLQVEHQAAALRAGLAAGQACPVCEQVIELMPATPDDLQQLLANARAAVHEAEKRHGDAQSAASMARAEHHSAVTDAEALKASLPPDTQPLTSQEAVALRLDATERLDAAREIYKVLAERRKQADLDEREAATAISAAQEKLAACESRRDDLAQRMSAARARLDPVFGDTLPVDAEATTAAHLAEIATARENLRLATEICGNARAELEQARADREQFERDQKNALLGFEQLRGAVGEAISGLLRHVEAMKIESISEDSSELPLPARMTALDGQCGQALTEGERHKALFIEAIEQMSGTIASLAVTVGLEPGSGSIADFAELLAAEHTKVDREARSLGQELENLTLRIERRRELEGTIAADDHKRLVYDRLGRELQADKFLAYVLSESMRMLAGQATFELKKITAGRYSIEPKESDFEVIDHDNADERRSVATLSGGETFLASLALALALSGSVRDLAGNAAAARVESMFIDEGFGALDAETLDTAVGALEALAGEHRMIGVISHVPALAERIPAGLEVRKVGASSTVTRR